VCLPTLRRTLARTFRYTHIPSCSSISAGGYCNRARSNVQSVGALQIHSYWTSNYGRDEDLLRLVTPGFGDCLQYIQFIVLAGSLNLNYPVSTASGQSSKLVGTAIQTKASLAIKTELKASSMGYIFVNGTYGLSRLGQLVGMSMEEISGPAGSVAPRYNPRSGLVVPVRIHDTMESSPD